MRKRCADSEETHLLTARREPGVGPSPLYCQRQQRTLESVGCVSMQQFALPDRVFRPFPKRCTAQRQKIWHTVELTLVRELVGQCVARRSCYEFSMHQTVAVTVSA